MIRRMFILFLILGLRQPVLSLVISVLVTSEWPFRHSRSFKVTDFGTNRKLICDFLLVIDTNLPPILHRFKVMGNYR